MAGHIESQRECEAEFLRYGFEAIVDSVCGVSVCGSLVAEGLADDWEQIVAFVFGIFVEELLHFARPFYYELLPRLVAAIDYSAVFQVGFFEESHVDEAHAAQIEAHQEHVAGVVEAGRLLQVEILDFAQDGYGQCAFHGFVHTGEHVAERLSILSDVFFHGAIVEGAQYPHIEGDSVRHHTSGSQPCLVGLHGLGVQGVEHNVAALSGVFEAVKGRQMRLGGAYAAGLPETDYGDFHIVEKRIFFAIAGEFVGYVVGRVGESGGFEAAEDSFQAVYIGANLLPD